MLIKSEFVVPEPPDMVWDFFKDVPSVASCLPGAKLTEQVGEDSYKGTVVVGLGPVRLNFAGHADIRERDEAAKRIIVDAMGSEERGRGEATLLLDAVVHPSGSGSRVAIEQTLHLAGAAAQYGKGMVQDVTEILIDQFAVNMSAKIIALEQGIEHHVGDAQPASGFAIALRALRLALARVARRFFLPYRSATE